MVLRFSIAALSGVALFGSIATPGIAADMGYEHYSAVPEMVAFDERFRDAGFYAGLRGGFGVADNTNFDIATPAIVNVVNNYSDFGFTGSAFIGYEMPDLYYGLGTRLEGEVGYNVYDVETHTVGGTPTSRADSFGETFAVAVMANAYIDYNLYFVRPFIGGGLGYARVNFENHGVTGALNVMNDSDNALAWQVMGGLALDVRHNIAVEGMVRYRSISGIDLSSTTGPESEVHLDTTTLQIGTRVRF